MPLHDWSTSANRQEAKFVLYSLWYYHTYRWPSRAQAEGAVLSQHVHGTATYKCDVTRDSVINFWPPDDETCARNM